MGIFVKICLICLFMNLISCAFYAILSEKFAKSVDIEDVRKSKNGKVVYFIDGVGFKTPISLNSMLDNIPEDVGICLIRYKNTGFDLRYASKIIFRHMFNYKSKDITVISVFTGHLLANQPLYPEICEIAINPYFGKFSLKKSHQDLLYFLPIIEFGTFLIGWLAYLPLFKSSGNQRYSIRLFVDHLSIIDEDDIAFRTKITQIIFLTEENRMLENNAIQTEILTKEPTMYYQIVPQSYLGNALFSALPSYLTKNHP